MNDNLPMVVRAIIIYVGGFLTATILYWDVSETEFGRVYQVGDILGSQVKTQDGEDLAMINDFVVDTNGHVVFALLSYGERSVAVPFKTLTYNTDAGHVVLNVAEYKLEFAPPFEKEALSDRNTVEDIYRHFGQQPYWSEGGMNAEEGALGLPAGYPIP